MTEPIRGTAAGVPFLAVPPADRSSDAPVVVLWHLMDAPSTVEAFAAALPLNDLHAWRLYFGLPMTGDRLPEGGQEEIMRRGYEDSVLNLQGPISRQGADELPAALADARRQLGIHSTRFALVGGSQGSVVAALAALETVADIDGALAGLVMISPVSQLRPLVDTAAKSYGFTYEWTPASDAIAEQLDFVARAAEFNVPLQIVIGADDDPDSIVTPARDLHEAVSGSELVVVDGMAHALAEEPGVEAAPQTPYAAKVDTAITAWLGNVLD